jgi:hypothetical protein
MGQVLTKFLELILFLEHHLSSVQSWDVYLKVITKEAFMRKSHVGVKSLAVVLFAVMTLWSSQVLALTLPFFNKDKVVCYLGVEDTVPPEDSVDAYTLNVKKHSPLDLKQKKFRYKSTQTTYTAVGKSTIAAIDDSTLVDPSFGSIYGMVMVAKEKGARMAFTRAMLLSLPDQANTRLQHFECQSEQSSATPDNWACSVLLTDSQAPFEFALHRVDPKTATAGQLEGCQFFPEIDD